MPTKVEQAIFEKVKDLPPDEQREVLSFIEMIIKMPKAGLTRPNVERLLDDRLKKSEQQSDRTIWEEIREISADVPDEVWEQLPRDGSVNVDHYLYGAPKKK